MPNKVRVNKGSEFIELYLLHNEGKSMVAEQIDRK